MSLYKNAMKAIDKATSINPGILKKDLHAKIQAELGTDEGWSLKTVWGHKSGRKLAMLHITDINALLIWCPELRCSVDLVKIRPHNKLVPACWESMLKYGHKDSHQIDWNPELNIMATGKFGSNDIKKIADVVANIGSGTKIGNRVFSEIISNFYSDARVV